MHLFSNACTRDVQSIDYVTERLLRLYLKQECFNHQTSDKWGHWEMFRIFGPGSNSATSKLLSFWQLYLQKFWRKRSKKTLEENNNCSYVQGRMCSGLCYWIQYPLSLHKTVYLVHLYFSLVMTYVGKLSPWTSEEGGGQHSTEVEYLLLTQQPWVHFPAFPKIFQR